MTYEVPLNLQQVDFPEFEPSEKFEEVLIQTALSRGYITEEQLQECVREKQVMESLGACQTIGQICVRRGYLSARQVNIILRTYQYQRIRSEDMEIGQLAIKKALLSVEQVEHCLKIQEMAYRRGKSDIPRLVHILKDRGLLKGKQAMKLLEIVQKVNQGMGEGAKGAVAHGKSHDTSWDDRSLRKRPVRRLLPRSSERFVVPDAYLYYWTSLLDAWLDDTDEQSPLIDLSLDGLQFLTRRKLRIGQKLRMELVVPAFTETLVLKGEVRWVGRAGLSDLYRTGVKFIGVNKEIASYLEKLAEDPFLRSVSRSPYRVYR